MARWEKDRKREFYYVAEVSQLRGCYTQAKTFHKLMAQAKEVIQLCGEGRKHH